MALQTDYIHTDGVDFSSCYIQIRAIDVRKNLGGVIGVWFWRDSTAASGTQYAAIKDAAYSVACSFTGANLQATGGLFAYAYSWLTANVFPGAATV